MQYVFCIVIGYFCGVISPSYFISKANGVDIKKVGSNNAGASNTFKNVGKVWGVLVALLDIFKAYAAAKLCAALFPALPDAAGVAGMAAVMGHMYPFYLGFNGGKGFASYTGAMLAINPKVALIMIVVCIIITLVTNYIVLATFTTMLFYPIYYAIYFSSMILLVCLICVSCVMLYRHRDNIKRLATGTEIGLFNRSK